MKVEAKLKNLRISPRKVRLLTDFVKGMDVENALIQLSNTVKASSKPVEKLIKSAISNAENNFGLEKSNLFIADVQVGEGPILKRWLPRAHGRATQLLKRTSIIYLTLAEKVEGKGRKAKPKKEEVKKSEENVETAEKKEEQTIETKAPVEHKKDVITHAKAQKGGFAKKVFQRKSA